MDVHLIGIDCAAQDRKCGLALGHLDSERLLLHEVIIKRARIVPTLTAWIDRYAPALVAIDAPLGWPKALADELTGHRAGHSIATEANRLFHRETDRVVWEATRKRPMEVGADKIARAALRAVNLLGELRNEIGSALPLAWVPGVPAASSVIEVYPATTLRSRGLSELGYKGTKDRNAAKRFELLRDLPDSLDLGEHEDTLMSSDDAFDAMLCLLAAKDFCRQTVHVPEDMERAKREGWIWFRGAKPA